MRRTLHPQSLPDDAGWWICETEELGATACPSELFANQASEVCRGAPNFLHVLCVRPANPQDAMDAIAIKQARKEIEEVTMDLLVKSGALKHKHRPAKDVGRIITLGAPLVRAVRRELN